jgi:hypothetical protein
MTAFYGGIDLHCNNSVVVVMDEGGEVVYRRRLANDLRRIQEALAPLCLAKIPSAPFNRTDELR